MYNKQSKKELSTIHDFLTLIFVVIINWYIKYSY